MPIVAFIAVIAASVWGAIYARRGSLLFGCALLVVASYVVGHEFWHSRFGPVPLTIDRLVLAALCIVAAVQWRLGKFRLKRFTGADWLLAALLADFALSALQSGPAEISRDGASPWGRLFASFLIPTLLYLLAREAPITRPAWIGFLACLAGLGVYLSLTAVCEITGQWSLVFPHYIADPALGIHFGRARGPGLNAASLGIYLTACLCSTWILIGQTSNRACQLLLLVALPLMALGVFFTYTRSTWIGLAACALVIAWFYVPLRHRLPAAAATCLMGLLIVAISWSAIIGLKREGTAAEAEHSVDQRSSFAYVSWQMFKDHPLFGVGLGQFYDRKMPYMSDRRQQVELESIRTLDHHNTFLSVLVETGLVGLAAFCAVLVAWARRAWALATCSREEPWMRLAGVLTLAVLVNYLCSAMFHDLTLVPAQQLLLFVFAGVTLNLAQAANPASSGRRPARLPPAAAPKVLPDQRSAELAPQPASLQKVTLFGMQLVRVTMEETLERVLHWCGAPRGHSCRFVVTPNVDHAVMFQERPDLRAAYADASLVLADGAPIVLASRLVGNCLPERVAGSDLVPQLLAAARQPLRVFLLGAAPGVAEKAADQIHRQWPGAEVVGCYSPPLGFENNDAENQHILARVAAVSPDLLIVGLGAPKQELWVHRHQHELQAKVALCVGATIDFLAGHRRRSPVWMQRAGLEWIHRVLTEPRRLARRYAHGAWVFPRLLWRERRAQCS